MRILEGREKKKRKTYQEVCADNRCHFTPLVYSVDGLVAPEAHRAQKRLGRLLSQKWNRAHSECCGFVSARIGRITVSNVQADFGWCAS